MVALAASAVLGLVGVWAGWRPASVFRLALVGVIVASVVRYVRGAGRSYKPKVRKRKAAKKR